MYKDRYNIIEVLPAITVEILIQSVYVRIRPWGVSYSGSGTIDDTVNCPGSTKGLIG